MSASMPRRPFTNLAMNTTIAAATENTLPEDRNALPKILMIAHYCSPYKGSDWGVGWGRAVHAARHCRVWVITSEQSRTDIERYIQRHGPVPNLTFIYQGINGMGRLLHK